ncbi:MAG: hypothetical protein JNJ45_01180 [Chthonomonas sp.]|nr:hypothetical protein [Chthonomonas sp.]
MSFRISLSTDHLAVEPGNAQPLSVTVNHEGDEVESFELAVKGIDSTWVAIPVPSFEIEPTGSRTERLLLRMPRETDSRAGLYPFVISVRSLATGESREQQGILEIKPYHNINVDVNPKKATVSPTQPKAKFELTVMNLGNQEASIQLYATDVDDQCVFEFDMDRVTLAPGQQRTVGMTAGSGKKKLVTAARLHGFSVTARSTELPGLMASSQAQLEERAALTPGTVVGGVALLTLAGAWLYAFPKPPKVLDLVVDSQITAGASLRVDWRSEHATAFEVLINGKVVKRSLDGTGFVLIPMADPGTYEVVGRAIDGKQSDERRQQLVVNPKPEAIAPEILEFSASPERCPKGGTVTITYKLGPNVSRATLAPLGQILDPKRESIQVTATQEGEIEYTLVAESSDGLTQSKVAKITVFKETLAKLIAFKIDKKEINLGESITLDWQSTGTVRAELSDGKETKTVSATGTMVLSPSENTTITLTLFDSEGNKVVETTRVKVKKPVEPKPTPDGPVSPADDDATKPKTAPTSTPIEKPKTTEPTA